MTSPAKNYLGKDASVLAQGAGHPVSPETELLFGETDESESLRVGGTDDAVPPLRALSQCRRGHRQGTPLGTWLPAYQHYSLPQRAQHDADGTRHGHHPVRQERALHGVAWDSAAKATFPSPSPGRRAKE